MKWLMVLMIPLLFAPAYGWEDIAILDLHYENGQLFLQEALYLRGFYPDRNIQPSEGYRLAVLDGDEEVYSFVFRIPDYSYVDVSSNSELTGGIVKLDKVDFSLTVPFPEGADNVVIYDEFDSKVIETTPKTPTLAILLILGGVAVIVLLAITIKKRRPRPDSNW